MVIDPRKLMVGCLGAALALAFVQGCSPKPAAKAPADAPAAVAESDAPLPPVDEPTDPNGVVVTLADCAGAAATMAGISPIKQAEPKTDSADENFYWVLLALMDKDPGFEGGAGRLAAETAMTAWEEKAEEDTRTYLAACHARFAPQ